MKTKEILKAGLRSVLKWLISQSKFFGKLIVDQEKQYGPRLPDKIISIEYYEKGDTVALNYRIALITMKGDSVKVSLVDEDLVKETKIGSMISLRGPIKALERDGIDYYYAKLAKKI
jgi:hypothetical protein